MSNFDNIMHVDEDGVEFRYSRELQPLLGYSKWQNFEEVINKTKISCVTSGSLENYHLQKGFYEKRSNLSKIQFK